MALNLNYEPEKIVDASTLTNAQWLGYRKNGIGGSDAARIVGVSPFGTITDLYYDKTTPVSEDVDPNKEYIFDFGHAMEEFVGKHFEKVFEKQYKEKFEKEFSAHYLDDIKIKSCRVYRDTWMYKHPLYPFMLADLDFRVDFELENGKTLTGIFECKTTSPFTIKEKWEDHCPIFYDVQIRHYMAVQNVNFTVIACAADNNPNNYFVHLVFRDIKKEELLISAEENFWQCVCDKQLPDDFGSNNLKTFLDNIVLNEENTTTVEDHSDFIKDALVKYNEQVGLIQQLNQQVKSATAEKEIICSDILAYMNAHDNYSLLFKEDNEETHIDVTSKISSSVDWNKFFKKAEKEFPKDVYAKLEELKKDCLKNPIPQNKLNIKTKKIIKKKSGDAA